jgi:DNA replication protein DnaC
MDRFIEHIATVRLDGTYTRFLNNLSKTPLLVLVDFGLAQLDINMQLRLLQIMEDRYKKHQIIITSQLPVKEWHGYIGESTIADAIMDKLTATNHRLELKGEPPPKESPLSSILLS